MEDSFARVLTEVNEKNIPKHPLTLKNVKPGMPEPLVHEEFNTRMNLAAVPGTVYYNQVDIFYKRLTLSEILSDVTIRNTEAFTPQLLIDMLNSQYNLFLTIDDVEPFVPPVLEYGQSATITLTARDDSYGFLGSIEIEVVNGKTVVDSVIGVRILPVLNHPVDWKLGKSSTRMLTWGIDFTSLRDKFVIDPKLGTAVDYPGLVAACSILGIPEFSNGKLTDSPTSAVPDSNPRFDRVTIMATPGAKGMLGALYFHYNLFDE